MTRPYTSPLSRPTDPATSSEAADRAAADGTLDTHEWWILEALRRMGGRGGTGSEIAEAINLRHRRHLNNVQVMRRARELLDRQQIHRRRGPDGRYLRRGKETIHWFGRGDLPLFDLAAARETRERTRKGE